MATDVAHARRIAVRAQLLDGSATDVLSTVRHLGFLQMDPISTVAPPQYLVLWSRLGNYDRAELDRLLWEEKKLFEWSAFIWPIEDLPLIRARMRERWSHYKRDKWAKEFLEEQAGLRRYVLRELERRGPLPSRELEHHAARASERTVWWGTRAQLTWMLELLHRRGRIAVAGRQGGQRLWDLAEHWYPETETVPIGEARRLLEEKRFRALGVKLEKGRLVAHPEAAHGARVRLLRPADPARRPDRRPHRARLRPEDPRPAGERRLRRGRGDGPRRTGNCADGQAPCEVVGRRGSRVLRKGACDLARQPP